MASVFRMAEIGVFWDMVDVPISDDVDRDRIYEKIRYSLRRKCLIGNLSITAYADEDDPRDCSGSGIFLVQGERSTLINKMIKDILFWAMNTREPSNLFVIAKDILDESVLLHVLEYLKSKKFNVVLVALPDEVVVEPDEFHAYKSSVLPLRSLLDGLID